MAARCQSWGLAATQPKSRRLANPCTEEIQQGCKGGIWKNAIQRRPIAYQGLCEVVKNNLTPRRLPGTSCD